jgi:sugar/nucleoside kinase (ribokinase family)
LLLDDIDPKKDVGFFTLSGDFIYKFCDDGSYSKSIIQAMVDGKIKMVSGDRGEFEALFSKQPEFAELNMQTRSAAIRGVLFIETDGANGIRLYRNGEMIHSPSVPFTIGVPETTGCGDSVAGAFLWYAEQAILAGRELDSIELEDMRCVVDLANALGHETCGTQQASLSKTEIDGSGIIVAAREAVLGMLSGRVVEREAEESTHHRDSLQRGGGSDLSMNKQ